MKLSELQQRFNPAFRLCQRDGIKTMTEDRFNEIKNILEKGDATHSERLFLTGYLQWIGFSAEEVMQIIDKNNRWLDFDSGMTWYQVCSVFKIKAGLPRGTRRRNKKPTLPHLPTTPNQRKRMQQTADWIAHQRTMDVLREELGIVWYEWERDGATTLEQGIDENDHAREERLKRSLKHLHQEITEHIHPYVATKIEKVKKRC